MVFDFNKAYKNWMMGIQETYGGSPMWKGNETESLRHFLTAEGSAPYGGRNPGAFGAPVMAVQKAWAQDILNQAEGKAGSGMDWKMLQSAWAGDVGHQVGGKGQEWMQNTLRPIWEKGADQNWIDIVMNGPAGNIFVRPKNPNNNTPGYSGSDYYDMALTPKQILEWNKLNAGKTAKDYGSLENYSNAIQQFRNNWNGGVQAPQPQVLPQASPQAFNPAQFFQSLLQKSYGGTFGMPSQYGGGLLNGAMQYMNKPFYGGMPSYGMPSQYSNYSMGSANLGGWNLHNNQNKQPNYQQPYGYPQQSYNPFSSPFAFSNQNKQNTANIWGNNNIWKA